MLNTEKEYEHMLKVLRFFLVAFFLFVLLSFSKFSCAQSDSSNALKLTYKGYQSNAYLIELESLVQCNMKVLVQWNNRDSLIHLDNKGALQLSLQGLFTPCTKIVATPDHVCSGLNEVPVTINIPCTLPIRQSDPVQLDRNIAGPTLYDVYDFTGRYLKRILVKSTADLKQQLRALPADAYILKGRDTRKIFNHP